MEKDTEAWRRRGTAVALGLVLPERKREKVRKTQPKLAAVIQPGEGNETGEMLQKHFPFDSVR